jgi:hypothetical protein
MKKEAEQNEKESSSVRDIIVSIICLLASAASILLFILDLNQTFSRMGEEPVGIITYKYHAAQRRFSDRVLWARLRRGTPVYNGDFIHTAQLSEAAVSFAGGEVVDLQENTLIQIFVGDDGVWINLGSGTVQADNRGGKLTINDRGTLIDANGPVISGTAPAAGQTALREPGGALQAPVLLAPANGGNLNTALDRGDLYFSWQGDTEAASYTLRISSTPDLSSPVVERTLQGTYYTYGRTETLFNDDRYYWGVFYTDDEGNSSPLAVQSFNARPEGAEQRTIFPPEDYQLEETRLPDLRFTWKTNLPQTRIQIAADSGFTRLVVNEQVRSNSFQGAALTAGTYYWRIVSANSQTPPRRFTVSAFTRQDTAVASSSGTSAGISAVPVTVTPAPVTVPAPAAVTPPTPVAAVVPERVTVPPPAVTPAPVRVEPQPAVPPPVTVSAAVAPEDRILPAALNRWPDGYTIGPSDLRTNRNILFSWDPVPGAESYIITLFQEGPGGKREIRRLGPITENSYAFEELSLLDTGNFTWQLEAVGSTGRREETAEEEADSEEIQRGILGESHFTVQFDPPAVPELKPPGVMYGR